LQRPSGHAFNRGESAVIGPRDDEPDEEDWDDDEDWEDEDTDDEDW